jgi:hypothetical protein
MAGSSIQPEHLRGVLLVRATFDADKSDLMRNIRALLRVCVPHTAQQWTSCTVHA